MPNAQRNFSWCFKWACWLGVLLCCSGILSAQGTRESSYVDLNTYRAELDRLAQAIARLDEHPEEGQAVRDSLPSKWVISEERTTYEVSTKRLGEDLEQWQKDPEEPSRLDSLQRRIQQLQTEADAFAASSLPSSDARQKLQKILARKEFGKIHGPTWLDELLAKIANWLDRHHGPSIGKVGFAPWIGKAIVWTVIVAVCLALAFVLWKWITRTQENLELNLSGGEQFHKHSREWVADALASARRGDYRNAIRCSYWAAVFRLEELGRWAPNRTLTPREYLRLLPADHFQRPPLATLTQCFELTWYGYAVATARDFDQVTQQLEKLGCLAHSAAATQKS
ncbi:MAG TPA: DUF4129 domain-containing protein [Terriglobales bacterium]|jgi:hypothetical protein|nr:DUF4129 domain-containing protein [Terriglobales bacterium]